MVRAKGTISPRTLIHITAPAGGTIAELDDGTPTNGAAGYGRVLARMDGTDLGVRKEQAYLQVQLTQALVKCAEAEIGVLKAEVEAVAAKLKEMEEMASRCPELISEDEREKLLDSKIDAEAKLRMAEAELRLAGIKAEMAVERHQIFQQTGREPLIVAPAYSCVMECSVHIGQPVAQGDTLFTAAGDLRDMKLTVQVPEADIPGITPGQSVTYTVDALPGRTFTGTVDAIAPQSAECAGGTCRTVEVRVDNPDMVLLPGMGAQVFFNSDGCAGCGRATRLEASGDVQAHGTLGPQGVVYIAPAAAGRIQSWGADAAVGGKVRMGDPLAVLDTRDLERDIRMATLETEKSAAEYQIRQARAASARMEYEYAKKGLERALALSQKHAVSRRDLADAQARAGIASAKYDQAMAEEVAARCRLELNRHGQAVLERRRAAATITAPTDGTVAGRHGSIGQQADPTHVLFVLEKDLHLMKLTANVKEADITGIHPGQEVLYTVDALPGRTFSGTVGKINPNGRTSDGGVYYEVEIDVENPELELQPGMHAQVHFTTARRPTPPPM